MKNLHKTAQSLKERFGLIEICGYEAIDQSGDYLVFDGLESNDDLTDTAIFSIAVARHSLNADKDGLLEKLDELRLAVFQFGAAIAPIKILSSVKTAFVSNTLYIARVVLKIPVSLEIDEI